MKLSQYNEILSEFKRLHSRDSLHILGEKFSQVPERTIGSIIAQEYQRKMKKVHHKHYSAEAIEMYYNRYVKAVKRKETSGFLLRMADEIDLSPALLARLILEQHSTQKLDRGEAQKKNKETTKHNQQKEDNLDNFIDIQQLNFPAVKHVITQMMRDTSLVEDGELAVEVFQCIINDDNYGPVADAVKHAVGLEFEQKLKEELQRLGIAFVAIDGHVVNWIESKASFGDEESHRNYLKDQYWSYWNRFGPGMVIYWFGFIEELDTHRNNGILLCDCMPEIVTYMNAQALRQC
ncbi:CDAN1-interacting nuclease 1 isoform X2 [Tachypleus tridentatus]|uniref:CDAN1-interacting nuclease 1 isoform X2 n=1 Tax=Tachypleus tridentatus TaxID=6853 RepID=UPI003FD02171